jgi:hypothetical protein
MQDLRIDRPALVAAREQPLARLYQAPVAAQDRQELRRQHGITVLAALALLDPDHHPTAVDIADLQPHRLRGPQAGSIGRGQRRAALQAGHGFEKAHDLVRAQHQRQLARLARIRDAFRQIAPAQRHAVEEAQGTDGLVERRPGDALGNELHLIGAHGFHIQPIGRAAKILTELRHRVDVRSLRRRRQIADRHVLDHAAAKRA